MTAAIFFGRGSWFNNSLDQGSLPFLHSRTGPGVGPAGCLLQSGRSVESEETADCLGAGDLNRLGPANDVGSGQHQLVLRVRDLSCRRRPWRTVGGCRAGVQGTSSHDCPETEECQQREQCEQAGCGTRDRGQG